MVYLNSPKHWLASLLSLSSLAAAQPFCGFSTYTQITEGAVNSVTYSAPDRSKALYVNVQILSTGGAHTSLFNDFRSLCANYGAKNISLIPRLRYGTSDGQATSEPNSTTTVTNDINAWAAVLKDLLKNKKCNIPVVQAGTLGMWGEWHTGPFCTNQGLDSTPAEKQVKQAITNALVPLGVLVAIRNPRDHSLVAANITAAQRKILTIHDDCILAEGPNGSDTGTFVAGDGKTAAQWKDYTLNVTDGKAFGGEPCPDTYNWSDWNTVCSDGDNGLVSYIDDMSICYLNPLNPQAMADLFHSNRTTCIANIKAALESNEP